MLRWNHALDSQLREMNFKPTSGDPCLYVHSRSGGEIFIVAVYVDDLILGGNSEAKMDEVKQKLSLKFKFLPWCKGRPRSIGQSDLDWTALIYREDSTMVRNARLQRGSYPGEPRSEVAGG